MSRLTIIVASIGVVMLIAFFELMFLSPGVKKKKQKKKKESQSPEQRDWQKTALRLEQLVHSLKGEISRHELKEKEYEKKIAVEKLRTKKFKDKINQEKEWHKREEKDITNIKQEHYQIKMNLKKMQESYSSEHAMNLKLLQDLKDLKADRDQLSDLKRKAEVENLKLKDKGDEYRQQIAQLKKDVIDLQKKKDDVTWIAKTDYQRIEKELKEKESEIERLRRQVNGEP